MSFGLKQISSISKKTESSSHYAIVIALITFLLILSRLVNLNELFMLIVIIFLAIIWYAYFCYCLKRKYQSKIHFALVLSVIIICSHIFNGAFLNIFYRGFFDSTLTFLCGVFLLKNRIQSISLSEVILLLYAPILIIFIPVSVSYSDTMFKPLIIFDILSLLFICLYCRTSFKTLFASIAISLTALLSFVAYPNYYNYLNGEQLSQSANKNADSRAALTLISQSTDSTSLAKMGNKIFILDVWYSGCGVCFKKFPEFEALTREYAKDTNLYFAALNIPLKKELDTLGSFGMVEEYSFNKLQATSTTDENKWGIEMGYPTLLVFDKNHKIRYSGTLNTNRMLLVNNIHKIIEELKKE